jgi:hypothetical protein
MGRLASGFISGFLSGTDRPVGSSIRPGPVRERAASGVQSS